MSDKARRVMLFILAAGALFLGLLLPRAFAVDPIATRITLVVEIIKTMALFGAGFWAVYTRVFGLREAKSKARYEQLGRLHEGFLGESLLTKRRKVTTFWRDQMDVPGTLPSEIGVKIEKLQDAQLEELVRKDLGVKFEIPKEDFLEQHKEIVKDTEWMCNQFEHLGKLHAAGAVSAEDIKVFFYTMIADTFLLVLPYILYRRKSKAQWARNFQKLVDIVPHLSHDPTAN